MPVRILLLLTSILGKSHRAYGAVFKVRQKSNAKNVLAAKVIELATDSINDIAKEIEILAKCQHRNIVSYQVRIFALVSIS